MDTLDQIASCGFDTETEILSDIGFIKYADFDKMLYRVAVATDEGVVYRKVLAYTIGTYTGDNVRISTSHGDMYTTPHTRFATEGGLVEAGSIVGNQTGILSAMPPVDSSFLSRLQAKYDSREDGYRHRFRVESRFTASSVQADAIINGYAATVSNRTVTIRVGRRFIRCICAEFVDSIHDMWNVVVEGDGGLVFIRRGGAVYMVAASG